MVIHDEEYERKYNEEWELRYNHWLLQAYFYHPERIEKYEKYKGMEVDSMYESLGDYFCGVHYVGDCPYRYTRYYPPEESNNEVNNIENTKRYYSFGFERDGIMNKDGETVDTLIVSTVYPISPAFDAGLKKRDRLLSVNGVSLIGLPKERAVAYLKNDDPFEDSAVFTVLRRGETIPLPLPAMQKKEVQEPTVFLDTIDGLSIPYIQVASYKVNTNNPNGTYAEFKKILQEIKGAKVAVMELRGNPGGNIGHCTAMAAELVPLNSMLLYDVRHQYDGKRGNVIDTTRYYAHTYLAKEGEGVDIKWIILINRGSASCSERFVAAVKHNRPETVVIGETSYGKGIGQVYIKTYLDGLAYITCLQTYYPNGETFHNIGIIPDVQAEPKDLYGEIAKAIQGFALAKRSPTPAISGTLPPARMAEDMEPRAYIKIETPLFHQWE